MESENKGCLGIVWILWLCVAGLVWLITGPQVLAGYLILSGIGVVGLLFIEAFSD